MPRENARRKGESWVEGKRALIVRMGFGFRKWKMEVGEKGGEKSPGRVRVYMS